jgi:hypothetical protein
MLILECSQGCHVVKIWPGDLDLWPWTSVGLIFKVIGERSKSPGQIFTIYHPCEYSRINTLQWILTKLGTYLVLRRIWNPIDFLGHRDSPKYVPSLVNIHWRMLILECSQGCYAVKIWPLDFWPWKSIGFQTLLRTLCVHLYNVPSLVKIHWRMLILECSQSP